MNNTKEYVVTGRTFREIRFICSLLENCFTQNNVEFSVRKNADLWTLETKDFVIKFAAKPVFDKYFNEFWKSK